MTYCTNCGTRLAAGALKCDACGASLVATKTTPPEAPSHDTAVSRTDNLKTRISAPSDAGGSAKPVAVGLQVGRVLGGKYQLDSCIGSGGMGEIYRARRLHIGDTVAVKVLRPDVIENEKTRQRFYREARAAAALHHPNAVVIHDFGEDTDGTAYIVMELLLGRSLRQLLVESGTVTPKRAYGIIRQASAALDAGHRNGIVHRDIKPDNIYLLNTHDDEDHIKILDFGIAKLADKALDTLSIEEQRLTNVGTVIGTPHYMSPEQCQGEEADSRSDIYSLGVVLYEMLTGVVPFVAKTPTGVAIKHVTEQPRPLRELNPALSPAIESAVLRALSKDASQRPQNAIELARDFDFAIRSEGKYENATEQLTPSSEQKAVTPAVISEELKTEILKPAADTGGHRRVETQQQSYDTVVSPKPGTEVLGQSGTDNLAAPGTEILTTSKTTGEQKLGTTDLKTQVMESAGTSPVVQKPETAKVASPSYTTKFAPPEEPEKKVEDKPSSGKAAKTGKKEKAEAAKPVEPVKVAAKPVSTVKPEPAPAKSRTPLLVGLGAVLLVIVGLGAWLLSGGDEQTQISTNTTSQAAQSSSSQVSTGNQFPQTSAPQGMALVIKGVLRVGRDDGKENEAPAHVVSLEAFYIGKTEVTNEEYQAFIAQSGHPAPPSWVGRTFPAGSEKLPVTDVTWEDASAFAKWAGKRLPTEEEWEYAARGSNADNLYPWGSKWLDGAANVTKEGDAAHQLSPVGQFASGASPFGAFDMIGNVWEWTASDYKEYPGGKIKIADGYKNLKVIRGGSFNTSFSEATATLRSGWPASRKDWPKAITPDYSKTGFRLAQDAN